jgi:hypothetical protein
MKKVLDSSALYMVDFKKVSENQTLLDVEFTTGGKYRYFGVPTNIFEQMINSESKGKFFQENIRDRYKFERLV